MATEVTRDSRAMPPRLPAIVQARLRSLTSKAVHLAWIEGTLWILLAFLILPFAQMIADFLFDLARPIRAALLAVDLLIILALAFRFIYQPWRRRPGFEEAALLAEKRWPQLRTSLISALQLARHPDGSPLLVDALLHQTARRVADLDFRLAVERKQLGRLMLVVLCSLGLVSGVTLLAAPRSYVLWQRFALSNLPLPTETIVVPISRDFEIQPGETIELAARAQGIVPRTGRLELTYAAKPSEFVVITPKQTAPDTFSLPLPNVQQPLTYRFYLNDGRGPLSTVTIVQPPIVQALKLEQIFPAYTGLPRTAVTPGSLTLLAGSRLEVSGRSDQPLRTASLTSKGPPTSVSLHLDEQREAFQGELVIPVKNLTGFSIALENSRGVKAVNNAVYAVEIVPDKPPEITVAPNQPSELTIIPTAHPRLRFSVRDDFQVKQVFLCVQPASALAEGELPDPAKAKKIPVAIPKTAPALAFDYEWKEPQKTVDWREGTVVNYWIEAIDNNDVTGPGVSHTPVRQWTLVSVETKRAELTETLRKHAESIEDLSRTQQDLRARVEEMLKPNQ